MVCFGFGPAFILVGNEGGVAKVIQKSREEIIHALERMEGMSILSPVQCNTGLALLEDSLN